MNTQISETLTFMAINFNKDAKAIQWKNNCLFKKWC